MRAHAHVRVERELTTGGAMRTHVRRLHSDGALSLRPTNELLPEFAAVWGLRSSECVTIRQMAGTAGPLGGDHFRLDIDVGANATLMLSAVAATLVLPGPHGLESRSEANITVAAGGTLIWLPGAQIAAEACHHSAVNRIDLADSARLYAREEVILGRYGEQPGSFRQRLRVTHGGRPLYDQELAVGAHNPGWNSSAVVGGRRALGSLIIVDTVPENLDALGPAIRPEHPDTAVMRLAEEAALITGVAPNAIELRRRLDGLSSCFGQGRVGQLAV